MTVFIISVFLSLVSVHVGLCTMFIERLLFWSAGNIDIVSLSLWSCVCRDKMRNPTGESFCEIILLCADRSAQN